MTDEPRDDRGDDAEAHELENEVADSAGEYEQTGGLGTGTQGDSIARELADRD